MGMTPRGGVSVYVGSCMLYIHLSIAMLALEWSSLDNINESEAYVCYTDYFYMLFLLAVLLQPYRTA